MESRDKALFSFIVIGMAILVIAGFGTTLGTVASDTQELNRTDILTSENHSTTVVVFYSSNCMYCDKVRSLVSDEANKYDNVTVKEFDVSERQFNENLYHKSIISYNTGVPAVQVGNETRFGYTDELEQDIRNKIAECSEVECGIPDKHNRKS